MLGIRCLVDRVVHTRSVAWCLRSTETFIFKRDGGRVRVATRGAYVHDEYGIFTWGVDAEVPVVELTD